MRKPSRKPQPPSWREIVVTIYRGICSGRDARGNARKATVRWIAGGVLCVALAVGISLVALARERSAKKEAAPEAGSNALSNSAAKADPTPAKVHKGTGTAKAESAGTGTKERPEQKAASEGDSKNEKAASESQEQGAQDSAAHERAERREEEGPELVRARSAWFHDQRAYPFEHIPEGALQKAVQQRDAMKARQRLAAGPQSGANGILSFPGDALWHLMGPQPVNNQFGFNGGFPTASGRVTAIAVDPSTPSTVYIGGAAGGVWKTTDSGAHWTPLTDSQPSLAVGSIAIDPNSCSPAPCQTIYVGTGEQNFNGDAYYGVGVLKSINGGNTWTQNSTPFAGSLTPTFGGAKIGAIAVQPGNSSIVLAAAYFFDGNDPRGGIYRSADGGATWALPTTGAQGSAGTAVVFDPVGSATTTATVYAALGDIFTGASSNGIWKSTDSGANWTLLAGGLPTTNVGRITLGYAPSTTGATATIYAAIADSSSSSSNLLGLFKTTNGGTSWNALTGPAVTNGFCATQCFYDMAIGVQPTNASVVVLGGGPGPDNFTSLFESQDGGSTWTPSGTLGTPTPGNFANGSTTTHVHVDTHAIVFTPNGGTLFVGDDGGIWSTATPIPSSGVSPTWSDLNAGLAITQFYPGISAGISDENYGFGGTQDNDTELFSGALQWDNLSACGDGGFTAIDPGTPTTVYTSCDRLANPVVQKSVFNGAIIAGPNPSFGAPFSGPNSTFNPAASGIATEMMEFIPPLTIDGNNPNTLYFGTCHLYQTNDGATTWTAITGDLASGTNTLGAPCGGAGDITTMDVSHQSSSIVVAGTSNGKVWESLTATAGSASTWTEIDNGKLPPRHITAVRTLRSDSTGNVVYATLSGFGACAGCGATPGHVFVTTNATSGAPTWTNISGDLPDIPVNDLIVDHNSGNGGGNTFDALYIATDVGVFSCPNPAASLCANWIVVGDGLPNSPVLALAMRTTSRILRAATHGRSVWDIQLTDESAGSVAFLSSLTPAAAKVGDSTTAVTVTGANFSANTLVLFDGVSVGTPTFVNTTQLTISVNSSLLTNGHVYAVSLSDPQGAENGSAPFAVMNPVLNATNMTPSTTTTYTPVTLNFSGGPAPNFVAGTLVTFNNIPLTGGTVTGGGTGFSVPVPVSLLTTAGPVTVTITNPVPGGGPSPATSFAFTITANPNPVLFVTPSPIILGPTNLNTTTPTANITIINPGGAALNITAQSITGTNAANFAFAAPTTGTSCNFPSSGQSGTGTVTLAAGTGTCNFGMTYFANPTTPGNATSVATLNITDNASGSPQPISVLGVPNGQLVGITPVFFGPVGIGTTSATMNATLVNTTSASINVDATGFTISGTNSADFQLVAAAPGGNTPCPAFASFVLNANSLCDVGLAFTPSIAGNETASINVSDNGPGSPQSAPLIGVGVEVTSISPSIVATGGPAFTLTVDGGGFATSAVVNVGPNGTNPRPTTFVNANQLQASIPASDIATAGTLPISVTTPNPGGTASEPKTLFIAQARPANNDNINFAKVPNFGSTTIRTASGSFTGGSTGITLTWGTPFPDTNYTAVCTAETTPGSFVLPTITLRTATSITVVPTNGGTPSGVLSCMAIPDSDTSDIARGRASITSAAPVIVTWNTAFANTSYVVACTAESSTAAAFTSVISTLTTTSVTVDNSVYASGTMHCIGVPVTDRSAMRRGKAAVSGSGTVTVNWNVGFNNTTASGLNYAAVCSDVEPGVASTTAALAISAGSKTDTGLTVINEIPSGTLHCLAVPFGDTAAVRVTEDTTQATAQLAAITSPATPATPIDPTPACVPAGATLQGRAKSVWWNWTAPANGTVVADTRYSSYSTILSVWTLSTPLPSSAETFTAVACQSGNVPAAGASPTESLVNFAVTSGTTYYFMVSDASSTGAGGILTFAADFASVAPANDDNAASTAITPAQLPYSNTENTILATPNTNSHSDPVPPCAPAGAASGGQANSVWYTFTPSSNGTITADTLTSPYETILNVTSGTPTGTQVACNQSAAAGIAQSQVSFAATSGTAYFFMISSVLGDGGTTNFHLSFRASGSNPAPTLTSISPTSATAGGGAFTLTLTGTNFIASSTVNFGANPALTPTSQTSTQLQVTVPAADIATGGTLNVTATNPAPGGGTSSAQTFTINNPAPTITSLSPSSATAGSAGFTLTVNGTNFVSTSVVNFNGAARTTTFVNATQLTASITAADIGSAGTFPVTVTSPAPGGGTSASSTFTVNNPAPTITSLSPSGATAGGAAFTLTVNGTGFVSTSSVKFNGNARTTTFVSATQVTAAITAGDIATAGSFPVTVTNPAPGGGTSAASTFTVSVASNPVPTLTSISPTTATAGGAAFTLTLTGTNFVASSTVNFGANPALTPTSQTATQLQVTVPATDITTGGAVNVTVTNPAPGGGTSSAQSFTINNPATIITSLSPSSATAGGAAFTLTINGTSFVNGATGTFNGNVRTVTFVSATQVTMAVTAADIAVAGAFPVVVSNPAPGGGTTGAATFTVNNVVPTLSSISPTSATVGGAAFTLTLNGTGFVTGSTVKFGVVAPTATFVSATQLTAAITAADIATAGVVNVTVTNPSPGGGTSGSQSFTINNPVPAITSLSPTSATAGSAAFTLTINGTSFITGATGTFNGVARTVTFVSGTQVTMAVTAPDIATAGSFPVVITNPGPGGGASAASSFTVNNPAPTITSLSPTSATAGAAAFALTVNGTNFVTSSVVNFNGAAKTTTFVSATKVTAAITAADIATAGVVNVTVTNPSPGGGTSGAQSFTINNPVPTITSFSPTSATVGGAAFTLTINGTSFITGATGTFNGVARTVTFVSGTQVTMAVTAPDIATAGSFPVVITNPGPGGGASAASSFTVNNPAPTISSLSPTGATAGGAAFTLTVNGTGFVTASQVSFNGNARTTTFVSATQVTAAITAADIATAGSFPVTVANPAPGGGTSAAVSFNVSTAPNPVPTLTSISPTSGTAGGAGFTLTLTGTNFINTSTVSFNGVAKTTTFVSATQITAAITAADIAAAGSFPVTVTNPAPGGGTSSAQTFTVNNPAPTIASLSPTSATAGGAAFTLTVNGTGLVAASQVKFNGNARTTTFVSATQITASITAADIAAAGSFPVTVTNAAPGGGTSAATAFTVNNPSPTISSLSPNSATAGGAAFTLTVNGTNLVASSVVNFNGSARTTTFVSATQITAAITAADIATAGTFPITVTNPAPGGGTSASSTLTVNNPAPNITSLSPTGATAGGTAFTLTVNGTGFVSASVVSFNGTAKTTTFVSATQLTAAITAADIASAGNANVTVANPAPGGGTSTVVVFTIASAPNPVPTLTSISPTSVTAGGAAFTLTVNGTNFVSSSVVNINGSARTTTAVSASQLTAAITAADIATAGSFPITVFNPAPGGGTSSAVNLTVNNPVPAITALSPSSATVGGGAFTLTVNGTGFVNGASVSFNGNARTTSFISSTQVTAVITAADIAAVGSFPVLVTNPAPGGGASVAVSFAVNNPVPAITSLLPSSAITGGAAFTLTVNGTGFVSGAVVNFNGAAKTTTFVSSTQVTAAILATDIATAGNFPVTVTNPAPGGGTSAASTFTVNNPAPTITSLAPTSATAGGGAFTLTVNGTNFVSASVVNFNGSAKTTTFVSATQVTAAITATDIAAAGNFPVTVTNPAPGGGTSAASNFTVNNPVPTVTSLSPTSAMAGGAAFTLTVNGTNFVATSVVNFNGVAKTTTFVSATQVTAAISAADIATAGSFPVTVTNPTPGGGTSAATNFTVNNPAPAITSLSPSSATAGGAAFTLTVNGTGFVAASKVTFNGAAKATTFVSSTQLTAAIAAVDITAAGVVNVTVTNPAPGGGISAASPFTINNAAPTLTSLSPSSATAGGAAFTLTVNGTGFISGATVQFNGANRTTTFVSATQVTAAITAADIASAGSFNVTVTNPAPTVGPSSAQTFTVNNPVPTVTTVNAAGKNHAPGGAGFTLTVNGTNFVSSSVINFVVGAGTPKAEPTTFVSATQLTAAIPASDVSSAGTASITVTNPSPGGGTTAANTSFTVDGYTVAGPGTPPSVKAGQPATIQFTVTPTANGFANAVSFSVSGLPAHSGPPTFSPTSVTPGSTAQTVTLTIPTTARGAAPPVAPVDPPTAPLLRLLPFLWLATLLSAAYAARLARRAPQFRRYAALLPLVLLLITGAAMAGCIGGKSGTPSGPAQLTITATSGTMSQTTNVTLTVN